MHRDDLAADYKIIELREVDDLELVELLSGSLSTEGATAKTTRFWNWKHQINPFGVSLGVAALSKHDNTLAGVRPLMRWAFKSPGNGQCIQAVRPVDTVTHPLWRGKGIFRSLTLKALCDLQDSNIQLVFNTPNQNSMPGYLKLQWRKVESLKVYVGLNRMAPFLYRVFGRKEKNLEGQSWSTLSKGATRSSANLSDQELRKIIEWCATAESFRACTGLRTVRSSAFLRWRFTQQPNADYAFTINRDMQGEISSVVVLRLELRSGLIGALIQEVFVKSLTVSSVRTAIRHTKRDLSVAFLAAHFNKGSAEHGALLLTGFFPIKKVILTARPISAPDNEGAMPYTAQWDLTLADIEVF